LIESSVKAGQSVRIEVQ